MRKGAAAIGAIVVALLLGFAFVYWVEQGNAPQAVRGIYDDIARTVTGEDPQRRCYTNRLQPDGTEIRQFAGSRACYDFLPPRRFSGIYVDEFEGQMFLEGAGEAKRYVIPCRQIWFSVDEQSDVSRWKGFDKSDDLSRVWLVDFIGRATPSAPKGQYGHMGVSEGEVLVDRVISARLLGTYEGYSYYGKDDLVTWQENCPIT